jgi:hypothetical protein
MILWLALACAHRPDVTVQPVTDVMHHFSVTGHGHTMAGQSVLSLSEAQMDLKTLTPFGTLLFSVRVDGDHTDIRAANPRMEQRLKGLPFFRDMALIYAWNCPGGHCATPRGRVCETSEDDTLLRQYRGQFGAAKVRITEGRAEIVDARNQYTVTVIGEDIHVK